MVKAKKIINGVKVIYGDLRSIAERQVNFYRVQPSGATLFLTYRCNSRCKTCSAWRRPQDEERKKEITFDGWKTIIDKLFNAGVSVVELFGGNVLLRKELLINVLRYLDEKGFTIHLPTNQIGLDDEIAEVFMESVDMIYLSSDGFGESQNNIRGKQEASKCTEEAIIKLLRFRKQKGYPRIICNTTVSKYNADILDQIIEYACNLGFDEIHYEYVGEFTSEHINNSMIGSLKPEPFYIKQGESVLVDKAGALKIKESLSAIKKNYLKSNIQISTINIDMLSEKHLIEGAIPYKKCYVERNEVTVDPSGNVVICPSINNYKIGNLLDQSLEDIWNNDIHKKFRKYQNNGSIEMCKHCILGVQRNPGFLPSVKRIYFSRIEPELISSNQRNHY